MPWRISQNVTDIDRTQSLVSESAVLVGVILPENEHLADDLEELQGLANAAGCSVAGLLTQRKDRPDSTFYLGKGKAEELRVLVESTDADVIIFDNDLTPAQTRSLEKATNTKVIDRTELILDIFASHARTYESRLAVELAQLEYSLPRLKRMWTHLSRLNMGVGMRGPGEKQLEVDRRLVEKRIHDLRSDLKKIERRRERQVAGRSDHMTVSLVGYTNAGKSTLMNTLTGAGVLAADQLFATLDTRTRRWQLPHWGPVLLSDTVGFIRNLPHRLIASFKATLEEARQTDLLLHVCDASNNSVLDQVSAVYGVLEDLDIEEKNTLLVVNKIDSTSSRVAVEGILRRYPNAIPVSAKTGEGLELLAHKVSDALSYAFCDVDVEMNVDNGKLMAYLAANGEILSRSYVDNRVSIHCRMPKKHLGRIRDSSVEIRAHQAASVNPPDEQDSVGDSTIEDVA